MMVSANSRHKARSLGLTMAALLLFQLVTLAQGGIIIPGQPVLPVFHNPVLVAGQDGANDAVYRFPNISPDLDALVTITRRSNTQVTVENIDVTGEGYDKALQPHISYNGGMAAAGSDWWVEFRIDFVATGTFNHRSLQDFWISPADLDGDNKQLMETAVLYMADDSRMSTNSSLTMSRTQDTLGGNLQSGYLFEGTRMDFPGIDSTQKSVAASCHYTEDSSLYIRLGGRCSESSSQASRTYSLFFRPFVYNSPSFMLPLMLYSFDATLSKNVVNLNWVTSWEKNLNHFEMETSTDGKSFEPAVYIRGIGYSSTKTSYSLKNSISSRSKIIYYRLKLVTNDGNYGYSAVRIIRPLSDQASSASLLAFPNPARSQVRITLPAGWEGKSLRYEIFNVSGKPLKTFSSPSASQTETMSVDDLPAGIYFIRVSNGADKIDTKIIKE